MTATAPRSDASASPAPTSPDAIETKAPEPAAPKLSHPRSLLKGKPLPTKPHTFRWATGEEETILLQGLPHLIKSRIDGMRNKQLAEEQRTGVAEANIWGARLIAAAVRTPSGGQVFETWEKQEAFALMLAEQLADGEIALAGNLVLALSGSGPEAEAAVGKSSTTIPS